jgi:hypothetical protein|tara:strand:- start:1225 stop:1485 length:261 start_codon:yes stop_codon:yes gene_type:complete
MLIKTKTLWNGFASVSTILIDRCVKKKENMEIQYGDSIMVLPLDRLNEPDWVHKKSYKDKFKNRKYKLYNFKFKETRNVNQESLPV